MLTAPLVPPPVKPLPAPTDVISAVFVLVIVIVLPLCDTLIPDPPAKVSSSSLLMSTLPAEPVVYFHEL